MNNFYNKLRLIGQSEFIEDFERIDNIINVEELYKYVEKGMRNKTDVDRMQRLRVIYYCALRYIFEKTDNAKEILDKARKVRTNIYSSDHIRIGEDRYSLQELVHMFIFIADDIEKDTWNNIDKYNMGDRLFKGLLGYRAGVDKNGYVLKNNGFKFTNVTIFKDYNTYCVNSTEKYKLDFSKYKKVNNIIEQANAICSELKVVRE